MENKTGVELIAQERKEQIEKHGFSLELDAEYYKNKELLQAAEFALCPENPECHWPVNWDQSFADKIKKKDRVGQLKVAGALIAAEIDRLQSPENKAEEGKPDNNYESSEYMQGYKAGLKDAGYEEK